MASLKEILPHNGLFTLKKKILQIVDPNETWRNGEITQCLNAIIIAIIMRNIFILYKYQALYVQ